MARPRISFYYKHLMDLASKMLGEQYGESEGPTRPAYQSMEAVGSEELTGDPAQELKSLPGMILEGRPKYRQGELRPIPQWVPVASTFISAARLIRPGVYPYDPRWNHPMTTPFGSNFAVGVVYVPQIQVRMLRDGHEHAYEVHPKVVSAFIMAMSKGRFIRRVLMGYQWSPWNRAHRYPHWALSHGEAPPPA